MTREEIIAGLQFTIDMFLFNPTTGETYTEPRNDMDKTTIDACRGAIKLLKQESEKDEVILTKKEYGELVSSEFDNGYAKGFREALEQESLGQEPKTGHWIIIDDCEKFIAKCSECGRIEDSRMIIKYPYCHCGAKM